MATLSSTSPGFSIATACSNPGLQTPISLQRSRLTRSQSAPVPSVPSTILVSKNKITKSAKKASPMKKMTRNKHTYIQTHSKPPLAVRQISDEQFATAYNDCARVLHGSPFDTMFWEKIDSASSTASTKFVEVQSDIEDAWNSLAELITNSIEQCECPRPSLNDVADDEDLCGLQFLDEEELLDGISLDDSYKGLELEELLLQDFAPNQ